MVTRQPRASKRKSTPKGFIIYSAYSAFALLRALKFATPIYFAEHSEGASADLCLWVSSRTGKLFCISV